MPNFCVGYKKVYHIVLYYIFYTLIIFQVQNQTHTVGESYRLNCVPPILWVVAYEIVTVFADKTFKKEIKVKRGYKVGALIQQNWCPYEKNKETQGV